MSSIDTKKYRDTLGCFTTGVCIVTAIYQDSPVGITVNSFASVSLSPPLVLWSLNNTSASYKAFSNAEFYNIHVLTSSQESLSNKFASRDKNKFVDVDWSSDQRNIPQIRNCKAVFRCNTESKHPEGDHLILVGRVESMDADSGKQPLIFSQGKYRHLK